MIFNLGPFFNIFIHFWNFDTFLHFDPCMDYDSFMNFDAKIDFSPIPDHGPLIDFDPYFLSIFGFPSIFSVTFLLIKLLFSFQNGFCFVEFDDYRDADDACYEMNGRDLLGDRYVKNWIRNIQK